MIVWVGEYVSVAVAEGIRGWRVASVYVEWVWERWGGSAGLWRRELRRGNERGGGVERAMCIPGLASGA